MFLGLYSVFMPTTWKWIRGASFNCPPTGNLQNIQYGLRKPEVDVVFMDFQTGGTDMDMICTMQQTQHTRGYNLSRYYSYIAPPLMLCIFKINSAWFHGPSFPTTMKFSMGHFLLPHFHSSSRSGLSRQAGRQVGREAGTQIRRYTC
jgi:hypothetical protein